MTAARRSFREQETAVSHGGGTGLPIQRECLETVGSHGPGKVGKLAEICAAVVLGGEKSLGKAVIHGGWVARHEPLGANR